MGKNLYLKNLFFQYVFATLELERNVPGDSAEEIGCAANVIGALDRTHCLLAQSDLDNPIGLDVGVHNVITGFRHIEITLHFCYIQHCNES